MNENTRLGRSIAGGDVQVFPLQSGLIDITTGEFAGINLIHCVADGNLVLGFSQGDETVAFTAGQQFGTFDCDTVEVSTGTFHLAK